MKNKKTLKVLSTTALLASLATPFAAPVSAADNISAAPVPTVGDTADSAKLGTIKVIIPAGTSITSGDVLSVSLPSDVKFDDAVTTGGTDGDGDGQVNFVNIPGSYSGATNPLATGNNVKLVSGTGAAGSDEVQLKLQGSGTLNEDGVIFIELGDMQLNSISNGPINVTLDAPGNSAFPSGTVTVGKVNSNGSLTVTTTDTQTANDNFNLDLRIKEDIANSLEKDNESLKFTLPDGFEWDTTQSATLQTVYGDTIPTSQYSITVNKDELVIKYTGSGTVNPSAWDLKGLKFHVKNETDIAAAGNITASISGASTVSTSDLVVGKYGEYKAGVSAKSTPTVKAGRDDQQIGDIVVKEDIEKTLLPGRTVTLTLPEGARWEQEYLSDIARTSATTFTGTLKNDAGLSLGFAGYTGTDNRTAKFTVNGTGGSNSAAELKIEKAKIAVQAGFSGDLNVTVGGNAGLTGNVKVADVKAAVTATATEAKPVKIGLNGQDSADFTITEGFAGALAEDRVTLDLPSDVNFDGTPKVEVTDGDMKITNVTRGAGDNQVSFTVDRKSIAKPSTIKVSGVKLKLNRSVAEGPVSVKVQGPAVAETAAYSDWTNSDTVASAVVANVVTPAPTDTSAQSLVFKLGSTSYTQNGVQKTMDVAPFAQNSRTFLPVRFAAEALGASNVIWDQTTKTATIFKGSSVVQMKLGEKAYTLNGVKIPMDVAVMATPEKRIVLPIRYLEGAMGVSMTYKEDTQEIVVSSK